MPEILAPCLELFRRLTDLFREAHKRVSKAVWIKVRQASAGERLFKYVANRRGAAPVHALQPCRFKLPIRAHCDACRREKRIIIAPQFPSPQVREPIRNNAANFIADWEEVCFERLAEFCVDLACILINASVNKSTCFSFIEAMALSARGRRTATQSCSPADTLLT